MHEFKHLPEKFLDRLNRLLSPEEMKLILNVLTHKPTPAFRTNTLKTTTKELVKTVRNQGFILDSVPWYPDAFLLKNRSIRELTETESYKKGHIYIQNLSSMLPVLVLDPKPDEKVLDIAAAPGSKTTQLAAFMHNSGELVANDISRQRLYKLSANLQMMGVTNTTQLNLAAQMLWKRFPEYFDKTLVDVPCSMEGRIDLSDPQTYKDWSLRKIKELSAKQKYILRGAISATKVGGCIVYSTCTLAPEENEAVIDWILKKEGHAIELEEIALSHLTLTNGLIAWNKAFDSRLSLTKRVLPSSTMEGFFIAKIRKNKSTIHV